MINASGNYKKKLRSVIFLLVTLIKINLAGQSNILFFNNDTLRFSAQSGENFLYIFHK